MSSATPSSLSARSLEEVNKTVTIPGGPWWRRMFAFAGPAYMVAVGYMDPGNWATDIAAGSQFGYRLLWVLVMANFMAILLQTLAARLGLVTGRDLAQACRDNYNPFVRWCLFILCEIAIAACDLAEVLGTAIGLHLLTGIPMIWGVAITVLDVLLLLAMHRSGIRRLEAFIICLIAMVAACFVVEMFLAKPSISGIAAGLIPSGLNPEALYIAIGVLGATVMPHNLYLHSSLVQSRNVNRTKAGIAQGTRFNLIDSSIALNAALFVNAGILIMAAAALGGVKVEGIMDAHKLLENILGTSVAPILFAIALIGAGQSSTITGTLAGQITMEGFLHFRMRPWLRRLITRSLAIIPAMVVISMTGDHGTEQLLIFSQVVLSLQLPFAVVPLVKFTSSRRKMKDFANRWWLKILAWAIALVIISLNGKLVYDQFTQWTHDAGKYGWVVLATAGPLVLGLFALLFYLIFCPDTEPQAPAAAEAGKVIDDALAQAQVFRRIGVALEAAQTDSFMLAEAIALAKMHGAQLILLHVVEGVGGQVFGPYSDDNEARHDESYLHSLADRLRRPDAKMPDNVIPVLGYGNVPQEIVRLVKDERIDMLVMGGHGHHAVGDVVHGETIDAVRHRVKVPVLTVRPKAPQA